MRKATGRYRRQAASTNNACQPSGKTKRTDPSPPQTAASSKEVRQMEKAGSSGTRRKGPLAGAGGSAAGTAGVSRPYGRTHGGSGEQTTIGGGGGGERDSSAWDTEETFP